MPEARARKLARAVESWFARHQRPLPWRQTYDPYHVWISEVMLQQTRMEVVLPRYGAFLERFSTLSALAGSTEAAVLTAWSGLGYYRRARMLRAAAQEIVKRFAGRIPDTVDRLLSIPGIGRYTAGAISSIAFDRVAPIVDGNVARILARLEGIDEAVGSPALMRAAWLSAEALVASARSPRALNQGIMEIGALVCTPRNPKCDRCPLTRFCVAYDEQRVSELPRPKAPTATRRMTIPLYVITDAKGRVLLRHERGPLMDAMFHLPHGTRDLFDVPLLHTRSREPRGRFLHTVTNRRIEFLVYTAKLKVRAPRSYAWIDDVSEVAHPSYVKKALALVRRSAVSRLDRGGRRSATKTEMQNAECKMQNEESFALRRIT